MHSKIYVFISQVNHNKKKVLPSFTAYLYARKTIEDCTGAEEAGVELASKKDMISYTEKMGWEMPLQFWVMKTLRRLF